jgi:hypothetical protein
MHSDCSVVAGTWIVAKEVHDTILVSSVNPGFVKQIMPIILLNVGTLKRRFYGNTGDCCLGSDNGCRNSNRKYPRL